MTIPNSLLTEIKKGRVILFLGSGALYGANLPDKKIPLGNDLRDLLCEEFLDESFKSESLAHISAIAISQTSLYSVQDYIAKYFEDLEPANFHLKIPNYKWRALFTTNYDRLLELCYEQNNEKVQKYKLILSNEDSFDETRVTNDIIPIVKLHGCITRTHDTKIPLILTVDQYNESLEGRKRLFDYLFELAYENTIIFVGYNLQDHNIRSVILKLRKECPDGQRHYLIKPGLKSVEKEYWSQQKITGLDITFENFIDYIDSNISNNEKILSLVRPTTSHPIQAKYIDHSSPSEEIIRFLTDDAEFISDKTIVDPQSPQDFYKGVNDGWFSVSESLSIKRSIEDILFEDIIEKPDAERSTKSELYVLKGEAGSGKSILLRQLAWRSKSIDFGIFIWINKNGGVDIDLIDEISTRTKDRVFIIWDDTATNSIEINRFLIKARKRNTKVTIITAERYNEWNVRCNDLDELVTDEFELRYLSEREIDDLLDKLETYDCLGPNLASKSLDERRNELKEIHGRQLLVALHEATMGEPFEDIVYNEYSNIYPESAKAVYLTVCTLNRLRVPVRAGLISRIHDITFDKFKEQFYKPLEKVVIISSHSSSDIHYTARHSEIAEIVFRRALDRVDDRYNEYINIINRLNISYSSDRTSFRSLIRARSLHELFPDFEDVNSIYRHTQKAIGNDPYLLQQMANYERIRPNGSFEKAAQLLQQAIELAPSDPSIVHSIAILWRDKANQASTYSEKARCRRESRAYLEQAIRKWGETIYISTSLIELSINNLEDLIKDEDTTQSVINEAVRRIQQELTQNKQKYPSNGHIHSLEARLSELLNDHKAALIALEKSFEEKDRDPYVAIRLATSYKDLNNITKALEILTSALDRRRSNHKLNFHFAELIKELPETSIRELIYYYRRAFTPGDNNYEAQFWFARYSYESSEKGDLEKAISTFDNLRKVRLPYKSRNKIRDYYGGKTKPTIHQGTVIRKRHGYGFIRIDGTGQEIFCPSNSIIDDLWDAIQVDDRVQFNIGYAYSGVICCNVSAC